MRLGSIAVVVLTLWSPLAALASPIPQAGQAAAVAPAPAAGLSDEQIVQFLQNAKVLSTKSIGKGVTGATRATLSDGTLTHDAQIQAIEDKKAQFNAGKVAEFNFEDSWRFNVAAYRVDRLIGLGMVPVSVPRTWKSERSAFTWWIDDVQMDEGARLKEQRQPPDSGIWNEQMQLVKVFDQLIANTDRNAGNLLIGTTWRVWAIDHTRAFRTQNTLKTPTNIQRCDRQVLAGLKGLTKDVLKREIGEFVTDHQINALLARRDLIVGMIEQAGPAAVFERRR